MNYQRYLGHASQLYSVEEVRLVGGKGDGMRLLQVRNASGLEITISADRCADISRVIFKGDNMGYFAPCGYVSPAYYDRKDDGFMRNFTAGFLTTCGLESVGPACVDEEGYAPMHGSISNIPSDQIWWEETETQFLIHAVVRDGNFGGRKLQLYRTISVDKFENKLVITDKIKNYGSIPSSLMLLYHLNMGYPLLSEKTRIEIPSITVSPRDEIAAKGIHNWREMECPQEGYSEQCFYHSFDDEGTATVYNPEIQKGLTIRFDSQCLPYLTQWKKLNVQEYVLGLEPGNCTPDGRESLRRQDKLQSIQPNEEKQFQIQIDFLK